MRPRAIPYAIDAETGEKWVCGADGAMMGAPLDPPPGASRQQYSLLQLEVMAGIALKHATRELHLPAAGTSLRSA